MMALIMSGLFAGRAFALITVDTVSVGDLGNPADPTTTFGAVDYGYSIGKYEVTLTQYTAFLNAVARTDTYGLYNAQMASIPNTRGISRSGVSGSYTYAVIGTGNRPVSLVSWFDAARFVNWLNNGQPTGLQNASTTETGSYALNGAMTGVNILRSANAQFVIPTDNEFYKAAYYQPASKGGDVDDYWLYPTRSNTQPNSRNGSTTDPNSANYYYDDGLANGYNGGYATINATTYNAQGILTAVGAFTLASSYYGTFDQGGNVMEWDEFASDPGRGITGGSFDTTEGALRAPNSSGVSTPQSEYNNVGFRIALVPEPTAASLGIFGLALFARRPRRR